MLLHPSGKGGRCGPVWSAIRAQKQYCGDYTVASDRRRRVFGSGHQSINAIRRGRVFRLIDTIYWNGIASPRIGTWTYGQLGTCAKCVSAVREAITKHQIMEHCSEHTCGYQFIYMPYYVRFAKMMEMLDNGQTNIDYTYDRLDSDTIMHVAAYSRSLNAINKACTHPGAQRIANTRNVHGLCPLHIAAQGPCRCPLMRLMHCPLVNVSATTKRGETVLHIACADGDPDCVKAIVDDGRVDVNARDIHGRTCLMMAILHGNVGAIDHLLSCTRTDLAARDDRRRNLLMYATKGASVDLTRILLSLPAIDVNATDSKGKTAMHLACRLWGRLMGPLRLLLQDSRINPNIPDGKGRLPIERCACLTGFNLLLSCPCTDVNAFTRNGRTFLCDVLDGGVCNPYATRNFDMAQSLCSHPKIDFYARGPSNVAAIDYAFMCHSSCASPCRMHLIMIPAARDNDVVRMLRSDPTALRRFSHDQRCAQRFRWGIRGLSATDATRQSVVAAFVALSARGYGAAALIVA